MYLVNSHFESSIIIFFANSLIDFIYKIDYLYITQIVLKRHKCIEVYL